VKVFSSDYWPHKLYGEFHWVSRLRENLMSGSYGEGLETERWQELNGHEVGNDGYSQTYACTLPRQSFTRQVFFRQLKQNLQLCDFLGHSKNAIRWQIWTALLVYVLIRFLAFVTKWKHSFSRLFTLVRGVLWSKSNIFELINSYGTASVRQRMRAAPEQAYLPGFQL